MVNIYNRIRDFSGVARLSKHEQIVKGVLTSVLERKPERITIPTEFIDRKSF